MISSPSPFFSIRTGNRQPGRWQGSKRKPFPTPSTASPANRSADPGAPPIGFWHGGQGGAGLSGGDLSPPSVATPCLAGGRRCSMRELLSRPHGPGRAVRARPAGRAGDRGGFGQIWPALCAALDGPGRAGRHAGAARSLKSNSPSPSLSCHLCCGSIPKRTFQCIPPRSLDRFSDQSSFRLRQLIGLFAARVKGRFQASS